MVQARNMGTDREAALRRVAIVLSSLPAPVASQLMGSIDPESKHLLRRTMTTLTDVDPLERQRALQAFKGSLHQQPSRPTHSRDVAASESEDEITLASEGPRQQASSRVVPSGEYEESRRHHEESASSLAFLQNVEDDTLVGLLRGEHPQTIALVLASIAPVQAARVLPALDGPTQRDALSRIGRLGKTPPDVMNEIATHLRGRIRDQEDGLGSGQRALNAILAAMPTQPPLPGNSAGSWQSASPAVTQAHSIGADYPVAPRGPAGIEQSSHGEPYRSDIQAPQPPAVPTESAPRTRSTLHHDSSAQVAAAYQPPAGQFTSDRVESIGPVSTDLSAVDQTHRLRLVAESWIDDEVPNHADDSSSQSNNETIEHAGTTQSPGELGPSPKDDSQFPPPQVSDVFLSTDAIHQHLLSLSSEELCFALGKVSTRQAMLALCGLPNEVADGVMAVLPRAHAKQVRREMASLQSLQLREIDDAKEAVAMASIEDDTDDAAERDVVTERAAGMAA